MADQPKIIISAVDNTRAAFSSVKIGLGQIEGVGSTLNGVIGRLAPLLGAATFTSFIKGGIDTLDMLGDLSDRTGVAATTLSGFQLVAKQSDTSLEALGKGLNKLSIFMATNADAARRLGVTAKDPAEAFIQLSKTLTGIEDPHKRAAVANKFLGKSFSELMPALMQGEEALRKQIETGKTYNGVTEEGVKQAQEFNDKLDGLSLRAKGVGNSLALNMLPSLNNIIDRMQVASKEGGILKTVLVGLNEMQGAGNVVGAMAGAKTASMIPFIGKSPWVIGAGALAGGVAPEFFDDEGKGPVGKITASNAERIKRLERQLESLKALNADASKIKGVEDKIAALKAPKVTSNTQKIDKKAIDDLLNPDNKTTGKSDAQKYSEDVASLIQSLQQASAPAQSVSEKLQDQLDAYKYLDPAVKTYLQGLIDQKSATDQLIESQKQQNTLDEAMRKWDIEQAEIEQKQIDSMNEKAEAIKRGLDTTIELTEAQGELNEMVEKGLISQEEADKYFKKLKDNALDTTGFMRDLGATFNSAFEDAIVNGQKFSNVLGGLAQDIERLFVRRLITDPFMKGLDSLVLGPLSDSFGGFFANAAGGVYAGAGISAYSGQLVSSPTVFPFAKGIGLMGEAGPEAILPLRRGSNGKLGVEASRHGGEITYNVEINIDANRNSDVKANGASASELGRQIDAAVRKVLIKEKMNGGILS